jgi:hypothetical protein
VLCIEFELSAGGVAGAVDDESAGAFGDVDCCLEHATMANALRHNKRRLRFIRSPHCNVGTNRPLHRAKPPRLLRSAGRNTTYGSQDLFRIAILAGKLQVRLQTLGAEYAPVWYQSAALPANSRPPCPSLELA